MNLEHVFEIARRACQLTQHRELVVIGSNSILGLSGTVPIPEDMSMSIDVDAFLKNDPGRSDELQRELGEGSPFHAQTGTYIDVVSPKLLTAPAGWANRLNKQEREGLTVWFLDPVDAAISKLVRGEPRDLRWVGAGLAAHLFTVHQIRHRLPITDFLDEREHAATLERINHLETAGAVPTNVTPDLGLDGP